MNIRERWKRLNNPTCASDYGLSVSMEELKSTPGCEDIIAEIESWLPKPISLERRRAIKALVKSMRKTRERIVRNAMNLTFTGNNDQSL